MKKILFSLFLMLSASLVFVQNSLAQCSMCTINAEQGIKNGNTQSAGLNSGIMYLLFIPYLLALVVGIIWYKKFRKKVVHVNMKNEHINLN